jgi:hypothetical protein
VVDTLIDVLGACCVAHHTAHKFFRRALNRRLAEKRAGGLV